MAEEIKYLDYEGLSLYDQKIKQWGTTKNEEIKIKQTNGKSDNGTILVTPGGTSEGTTTNTNIEVNIDNSTIVQDPATKQLKVASTALTQYIGDKDAQDKYAISIGQPDSENNKKVSLDINSNSNVLEKTDSGVLAKVEINKFADPTQFGTNVREAYALAVNDNVLTGTDNNQVIKIYKDSALLDMKLLHATETAKPTYTKQGGWVDIAEEYRTEANLALCFAYENVSGDIVVEAVAVGSFLRESEFKNGLQVNSDGEVSVKIDPTSETFLTVSTGGVKLDGVQDAIDEAAANSKTTITEVAADDPIPTGGAAKIIVTKTVEADGHANYVISGQDLASAIALAAEVLRAQTAEQAIDSVVGLTKTSGSEVRTYTNTGNYIGQQTTNTVKSDIKALDTKLKQVSDKLDSFVAITTAEINSLFA